MTEEGSASSQVSVDMATTGMTTEITGRQTMTSSLSPGTDVVEFYFHCGLVVIGILGTATNGLILYGLVASKQHKKHMLIVNQNALDFFSSFAMVITYPLKLCHFHLTGSAGHWLCTLLLSEFLVWIGTIGSFINLATITVDRYLKVVHPVWSKKKLRGWMIYSAMAFSWIGSLIYNVASVFPTTALIDGACYAYVVWESETGAIIFYTYSFLSFYVIIILIFVVCYWRILVVIRRQASVMAGYDAAEPSTAQAQLVSSQMQSNVIKTMILVSAFFAITWLPSSVNAFYLSISKNYAYDGVYYASISLSFLYVCTNPFIYAIKFDPVSSNRRPVPSRKQYYDVIIEYQVRSCQKSPARSDYLQENLRIRNTENVANDK